MRMCYADPPYPGCAKRHYGPDAQEVNHKVLIQGLDENFDGWALSTGSTMLKDVLSVCPDGVRIGAWVKPMCTYFPNLMPLYSWEPVIVKAGRKNHDTGKLYLDYIIAKAPVFDHKIKYDPGACHGRKPLQFCFWVFKFLGLEPDDDFIDLFPGSGAVGRAWEQYKGQRHLPEFG